MRLTGICEQCTEGKRSEQYPDREPGYWLSIEGLRCMSQRAVEVGYEVTGSLRVRPSVKQADGTYKGGLITFTELRFRNVTPARERVHAGGNGYDDVEDDGASSVPF